jgi:CBS domain containing-hemolysin-like protein
LSESNLPVKYFNRLFVDKIPEAPEYATLAGFLQALTGRLLWEGETVRYQNLILTIEKKEGFRIVSVRVRTSAPKPKPA